MSGGDKAGGVVNLRQVRKRRAREEARREADANAARHGQPKADRTQREAEDARVTRLHDGHRRVRPDTDEP